MSAPRVGEQGDPATTSVARSLLTPVLNLSSKSPSPGVTPPDRTQATSSLRALDIRFVVLTRATGNQDLARYVEGLPLTRVVDEGDRTPYRFEDTTAFR